MPSIQCRVAPVGQPARLGVAPAQRVSLGALGGRGCVPECAVDCLVGAREEIVRISDRRFRRELLVDRAEAEIRVHVPGICLVQRFEGLLGAPEPLQSELGVTHQAKAFGFPFETLRFVRQ